MDGRRMIPDYNELVTMNYTYLAVGSVAITAAIRGVSQILKRL